MGVGVSPDRLVGDVPFTGQHMDGRSIHSLTSGHKEEGVGVGRQKTITHLGISELRSRRGASRQAPLAQS